jgi:hypothetical protein
LRDLLRGISFEKDWFGVNAFQQRIDEQFFRLCSQLQEPIVVLVFEDALRQRHQVGRDFRVLHVQQHNAALVLARKCGCILQRPHARAKKNRSETGCF